MDKPQKPHFIRRFYTYQKERFPLIINGLMIGAFTFSAISFSRICRGTGGFIPAKDYVIGVFITLTLFLLVRIFDEFKDKNDDAKFRPYLPVPRGLISLKELRWVGWVTVLLQIFVIVLLQPEMLVLYAIVLAYLLLMWREFFVSKWIKQRQLVYITSHMVIIPLIDIYASGLDWRLENSMPHWGLAWFFAVSYMNGIVLEFGRKIRTPETEEEGVVSYTGLYGTKGGTRIWIALTFATMLLAMGASWFAGYDWPALVVLALLFALCTLPGWLFLRKQTVKMTRYIEYASGVWTAAMYLTLGGVPMLKSLVL